MVVTRRMLRQIIKNASKGNKNTSTLQSRQCCVKLHRLSPKELAESVQTSTHEIESTSKSSPVKKYDLRYKPAYVIPVTIKMKPKNVIARTTRCPTKLWKELKKARSGTPPANSIVLAKMKSYSPWPSKLVAIKTKNALLWNK